MSSEPKAKKKKLTAAAPKVVSSLADSIFGGQAPTSTSTPSLVFSGGGLSPRAEEYFKLAPPVVKRTRKNLAAEAKEEQGGGGEEETKANARGDPAATVFVGNLPPTTTKRSLARIFRGCGEIHSVRLRDFVKSQFVRKTNARDATATQDHTAGNIFGYVCFTDVATVEAALELNGTTIEGTYLLRVNRADDKKASTFKSQSSVFLGNVPRAASESELANHFKAHGITNVLHVRLVRDSATGQGRGFGFAAFADDTGVQKALKLAGTDFGGRPLRVTETMDVKQPKSAKGTKPTKRARGLGNVAPRDDSMPAWQGVAAERASSVATLPKKVRLLMKIK